MDNHQENRTLDTIVALATPPGSGGIGIVRLSGTQAPDIASLLTGKPPPLARRAVLCDFYDQHHTIIDTGILLYYAGPASYTGEHVVELQGHGSLVVMQQLLQRVIQLGARLARPGEFTERAFINGKIDLVQAEAVASLIDSTSSQASRSAMRSLRGEFSADIETLRQALLNLRVRVEHTLDFPDEASATIEPVYLQEELCDCLQQIETICTKACQGVLLDQGLRMAIAGSPNVGKSTLFNRLAGQDVAIIDSAPGTTRDLLQQNILIENVPFSVTDTAGFRETENKVEKEGIERALSAACQADVILLVLDMGQEPPEQIRHLLYPRKRPVVLIVRNKIDLINLVPKAPADEVYISAKTGRGLQELRQRLKKIIGLVENGENGYMARTRHLDALDKARKHLKSGLEQLQLQHPPEFLAEDLRLAQEAIGTITGAVYSDQLLDEIFSRFCLGK